MIDFLVATLVASAGFVSLLTLTVHVLEVNQLTVAALHADILLLDFKAQVLTADSAAQTPPVAGRVCDQDQPPWVVDWCRLGALDEFQNIVSGLGFSDAVLCLSSQAGRYDLSVAADATNCQTARAPLARTVFSVADTQ